MPDNDQQSNETMESSFTHETMQSRTTAESKLAQLTEQSKERDLTSDEVAEALNAYATSIRQEFEAAYQADEELATANVHKYTQDFFKENVPLAAAQLVHLAVNAESETVKLKASQYVIERALLDAANDGDPIRQLLNELSETPKEVHDREGDNPNAIPKQARLTRGQMKEADKSLIEMYVPNANPIRKGDEAG